MNNLRRYVSIILLSCVAFVYASSTMIIELKDGTKLDFPFSNELSYSIEKNGITITQSGGVLTSLEIDKVSRISYNINSGVESITTNRLSVDISGNLLHISGAAPGTEYSIYSIGGGIVSSGTSTDYISIDVVGFTPGIYIVNVENFKPFKIVCK